MKAINIQWDTNDEEWGDTIISDVIYMLTDELPTEVEIPNGMTDEEEISDWLSEEFGFCHKGFELVE